MRRPRWTLRSLIVAIVLPSTIAVLAIPPLFRARLDANERSAAARLKLIVNAEENFRSNDLDRNSVPDYWTADVAGLHCIRVTANGAPIGLIESQIAEADVHRLDDAGGKLANKQVTYDAKALDARRDYEGYWFQTLNNDAVGTPYAQSTDGGAACHNFGNFGFLAIPSAHGVTGEHVFVVNEGASVFLKDYGPEQTRPVAGARIREFAPGVSADYPRAERPYIHCPIE